MAHSQDESRTKVIERLYGVVQGVGFRPFVARLAAEYALDGFVRNEEGSVYVEAVGSTEALNRFLEDIQRKAPVGSHIILTETEFSKVHENELPPGGFTIDSSSARHVGPVIPSPDISICEDCKTELFTPGDPRFENPFISCTNCGPRYTILKQLPYDRENISMAAFPMCSLCARQYRDAGDRRFHAQTVCCNACGPELSYYDRNNTAAGDDALRAAIAALQQKKIIAIKGIGGFHFACNPFDADAVLQLRALKGREKKPFAVMFSCIEETAQYCKIDEHEQDLLTSREKPIVLLERVHPGIAEQVFGGSRFVGAFLPYTPLQHLILRETGPLVMTSANLTGSPIIIDDGEMAGFFAAHDSFGGVLTHNRDILRRLDDSVVASVDGRTQVLRRARGYVPLPVSIAKKDGPNVLACGPQQKNTFCLSQDGLLYPSAEIGELDDIKTVQSYKTAIDDMKAVLGLSPQLICCDLHPQYESTKYALLAGLPLMKVQHHYAHIASVMAEENLTEPVIGVAFDGTGYGTDGTIWGGEFLIASVHSFERAGHLKPITLIGSDSSVREAWKTAQCLLNAADIVPAELDDRAALVRAALTNGVNTIRSSSMGRLFDGISALLGICQTAAYEGEPAILLENAAASYLKTFGDAAEPYPFEIVNQSGTAVADMTGCVKSIYDDRQKHAGIEFIAYRFHKTISQLIFDMCCILNQKYNINKVALSGGVFQNRILLMLTMEQLQKRGFDVFTNRKVPPNDGGISLGQAYLGQWQSP